VRISNVFARSTAVLLLLLQLPAGAATILIDKVNGYTLDDRGEVRRFARMVVADGRVQQLLAPTEAPAPAIDQTIDGGGRTLLPGLIDAHGHVLGLGQERLQADLRGSTSLAEALRRVEQYAAANPASRWLLGRGWNQVLWEGREFPRAADLDRVVRDRPVVLSRIDGHAIWVNTAALRIAGIDAQTKDPPGGQIVRDTNGAATGVFVDTAAALIEKHIPPATDADLQRALATALQEVAALGLTGVHDAGIEPQHYRLYEALGSANQLPIRVYAMLADGPASRQAIAAGPKKPRFDDRLVLSAVKAWVDGALGSRGAAMLQDYADQPHHRGLTLYTPAQLDELTQLTAKHGWQLNVHAIGDAGNRAALDAFAKLSAEQRTRLRPRIEHAQVIALEDIPRFAALGVIASVQPTHATSDMNMAEDRVGPQRIRGAYAWRKLLDARVRLAGGSDFPVELPNPFHGLYAAVTRQDRDGRPPDGWYPQEKLTRSEALRLFTTDAAYAAGMEQTVGSLQPGRWADFILLDRDYFAVPESEIDDIEVVATFVAGRKVTGS
jgi:predicted amidohydrolase YtcJ